MYGTLPVLTLPGATFSSRVAASLNDAVNLTLLLTADSRKEYIELAVALSAPSNFPLLLQMRMHIFHALGKLIFNSRDFSAQLEAAYESVFEIHPDFMHVFFPSSLFPLTS